MKTKDILQLANDCAYIREYVHNIKFNSNMLGDEFSQVCKHIGYYHKVNRWLIHKYGNQGKDKFIKHMNQLISRAPVIREWA